MNMYISISALLVHSFPLNLFAVLFCMFQSVMLVIFAFLLVEDVLSFCTNILKHKVNI